MHSIEMTSTLTSSIKGTENVTSSEIKIPSIYAQKISVWLSLKVKALFNDDAEKVLIIDTPQEQSIDITSAASIAPNKPVLLEHLYDFREPAMVNSFLNQYPFLVSLLLEANPHLRKHFPDQQIFLEVISDPETVDASQLVAIIVETSSPDEAFDCLERFDREWWISAVGRARGKLCINVEFV